MEAQAANMANLQEMVQTMKAAMEAIGVGAQKGAPQDPAQGSKGQPSEASVVLEDGSVLPKDRHEAPAEGPRSS